jgi:hypothetical protein
MSIYTPLGALGLALGICGAIAGANIIAELIFRSTIFSLFLKVIPAILQSVLPNDAAILWFTDRANKNLYGSWDVALIYFAVMPIIIAFYVGCWVFLVLDILGVFDIGTKWLIVWFALVTVNFMWAAVGQYAFEIRFNDKRLRKKGVENRMLSNPIKTIGKWSYYFISNWIMAPFTAIKIFLIVFLFVLLQWPAWLLRIIPAFRFDLTSRKTRRYYYAGYSALFIIAGLDLTSLH